jgi:transposase
MRSVKHTRRTRSPQSPDLQSLPVLQPHAAGIDVGATQLHVALPPDRAPETVRTFGTFTTELQALADWLRSHGITTVALESTGVYWIPVFQILETRGLEVCLVNARHVKNVRGRKTDVSDCQWLQFLHAVGLLAPSFRPPDAVCAVRSLLRHRDSVIAQASQHIQHMQKALTQMNLHLHHVLSDLTGHSGLRILDALLAGERDPVPLAALRDPKVKAPEETIVAALQGDWRPEHLFVLRQALESYRYCQGQLRACDAEIERLLAGFDSQGDPGEVPPPPANAPRGKARKNQSQLPQTDLRTELFRLYGTDLTQCPALGPATVATLFAELGADLSAFASAKRFCSWLGLCPDPRKSGGRVLRHQTRAVKHRVATAFRLAAQALHHSDTVLGQFYRRMRAKLGAPQAVTATAHKLARIFYHLVTTKEAYDTSVFERLEAQHQQQQLQRLRNQARRLGFTLTPTECVS